MRRVFLPLLGVALTIAGWWLAVIVLEIEDYLVPTPPQVLNTLAERWAVLLEHTWTTAWETIRGFALAIVLGVPFAVLLAGSRIFEQMVYPLLITVNSLPKVAIAPILVVWMGFGAGPKIVMVLLLCFFPIVLATTAGLKSTPAEIVELARSLDAGRLKTFWAFRLPQALPQVFVGLKTAISLAVIGAVIAEFVGADAGLGFIIVQSGASSDTALAFAAMVLLSLLSIVLFYAVQLAERLLVPWASEH
ncbi:ABC transporter permease [Kineosporia babensis]|uniref:ABC transporter permease n=1 Tax=Kineosporia babensis TaxID=499548 RepID=A0A9X1SSV2_9ACTN|nr:ABC transporter permease [Kineosporia babensis]MCD5310959.1 ABC transporter permease [Kineosporia babensis]